MRWVFGFVAAMSAVSPAYATTLKEVLQAADQYNLERKISNEQREKAAAEYKAAWTSLLPSLNAQASFTYNQYPVEVPIGPGDPLVITPEFQLDGILRAELPLLDTTRWFRAAAAGSFSDSAEYRDALNRDNVTRQVSATFFAYAAALSVRESARRTVAVTEEQQRIQEVRMKAGAATELDFLRAKAEVQRNRQIVADTDSAVANTRRALRTLTGLELSDDVTLPADNLELDGSLAELEARTGGVPAVKAAEKDAEAASRLAIVARLAIVPVISAHFTERLSNATGFLGRTGQYTTGLNLLWRLDGPTFFNMSVQSSQEQIAKLSAERQVLASRDQIHGDWERLRSAIEKITAAQVQVDAARRAAKVAQDRYTAGLIAQIDQIQSDRDLFSAEVNLIQARTELGISHVGLRVSSGLPLELE